MNWTGPAGCTCVSRWIAEGRPACLVKLSYFEKISFQAMLILIFFFNQLCYFCKNLQTTCSGLASGRSQSNNLSTFLSFLYQSLSV